MKRTFMLLSLILVVAMTLSACAQATKPTAAPQAAAATRIPAQSSATSAAATPTTKPGAPKQFQVTETDQGKTVTLNPGDSLVVLLNSNPSTGYAWAVKPIDNPVLSLTGEPVFKAESDRLGAPGQTTLTFKSVASGSQALTLLYQRSFEKDAQPLKTFTINVTISGSHSSAAVPNPASKYCADQGFTSEIATATDGSQYGVCNFPKGNACEEWAYYRGECKAGQ